MSTHESILISIQFYSTLTCGTLLRLQSNGLRKWHTVEGKRITGTIYELYTILEDL